MTQIKNYYIIVGREGTRPLSRWSPVAASGEANAYRGRPEPVRAPAASEESEIRDEPAR